MPLYRTLSLVIVGLTLGSESVVAENFQQALVSAALERTQHEVRYDGSYVSIPYPSGDLAADVGVCTNVLFDYPITGHYRYQPVME